MVDGPTAGTSLPPAPMILIGIVISVLLVSGSASSPVLPDHFYCQPCEFNSSGELTGWEPHQDTWDLLIYNLKVKLAGGVNG